MSQVAISPARLLSHSAPLTLIRYGLCATARRFAAAIFASACSCAVAGEGFSKLQAHIHQTAIASEIADADDAISHALCDAKTEQDFTAAARSDGILIPRDFVTVMQVVWCVRSVPSPTWATAVLQRLASPFFFDQADVGSLVFRSPAALKRWVGDRIALGERPLNISLTVSKNGSQVDTETSREGGFDRHTFVLIDGRWKLRRFVDGGAC